VQKLDDRFRKFLAFFISQINKKSIPIPSGLKYPTSRKQLDRPVRFTKLLTEPEWELEKRKRKNRIRKGLSNYPRANLSFRFEKVKPPPLFGVRGNYYDYLSANLGELQQLQSLFPYSFNSGKEATVAQLESRLSDLFFLGFEDAKEQIIRLVVQSWGEAMEETRIAMATDEDGSERSVGAPSGTRKSGGPKGPRKASGTRRTAMRFLKKEGFSGFKACKKLKELKIPLQSERLQTLYGKFGWDKWFRSDSKAFYRQWSADLKRPSF